jgi:hypothetical protein
MIIKTEFLKKTFFSPFPIHLDGSNIHQPGVVIAFITCITIGYVFQNEINVFLMAFLVLPIIFLICLLISYFFYRVIYSLQIAIRKSPILSIDQWEETVLPDNDEFIYAKSIITKTNNLTHYAFVKFSEKSVRFISSKWAGNYVLLILEKNTTDNNTYGKICLHSKLEVWMLSSNREYYSDAEKYFSKYIYSKYFLNLWLKTWPGIRYFIE